MTSVRFVTLCVCFSLLLTEGVKAQGSGAVVGLIVDSTGTAVPLARVTVQNLGTLVERTTEANEAGAFQVPVLPAGNYKVKVAHTGFKTIESSEFALNVGQERRVTMTLELGLVTETLTVEESAAAAVTENATLSTVVTQTSIAELPLNGRQIQNLALLAPGVVAGWRRTTASDRYSNAREFIYGAFTVNGGRGRSNDFVLDGVEMNLMQYGVVNFIVSNEAAQEFELKTSVPQAEFGRTMASTVNMVTRSGSNGFHGALYEFFRNNAMDANNTFNKRGNAPRGILRQNQFGGSMGGPIVRNKHFFFVNTELTRIIEGVESRLVSVPTPEEKLGRVGYIDGSGAPQTMDVGSRITPLSRRLLQFYPTPNSTGAGGLNYNAPQTIVLNDYQVHARTDHHLTARDTVMGRVSWNLNDQDYLIFRSTGPFVPGFNLPNPERTLNGTFGHFHTFGSSVVNEFRLGLARYSNDLGNGDQTNSTEIGLPNGYEIAPGIPAINFLAGNIAEIGGRPAYGSRWQNETHGSLSDSLTWTRGRHNLKLGGQFARYHLNTRGATNQRGTVEFDGSRNGLIPGGTVNARSNALLDLLLGLPVRASITLGEFGRGYRQWAYAGFVQDSWRATSKLTVNLGLRFEYNTPWTEANGKLSNLVPGGSLEIVGSNALPRLWKQDWNDFAPRLGIAYDLRGNGRTIIRAGFGISYETLTMGHTVMPLENNPPFSASAVVRLPTPFSPTGAPSQTLLELRSAARPSRAIAAVGVDSFHTAHMQQFHFAIQRMLPFSLLMELGYTGTRGVNLPLNRNINQVPLERLTAAQRAAIAADIATGRDTTATLSTLRPYSQYDAITATENIGSSDYHSFQFKLERRFGDGLTFLTTYTYSKSTDNASAFGSADASEQVLEAANLDRQHALSSFDMRHRLNVAANYHLPFARLFKGPRGLLNGWQLNSIVSWQTGQPFTPFVSAFDPYRNESFNRPNLVGDPNENIPAGYAFNPSAFRVAPQGTFGNAGRNIIWGDGFRSVDLSLFKNIQLTERFKLQMRFESVNSMNHVNLQAPSTNLASNPGLFIAAAQPRILQLGAKLSF